MKASTPTFQIDDLPGAELLLGALYHSRPGSVTISSCLLSIARPRLERTGLLAPSSVSGIAEPELTLYRLLREEGRDAFSRYNSLLRRLISFERAVERRARDRERTRAEPKT